jgi:hypothetical protein
MVQAASRRVTMETKANIVDMPAERREHLARSLIEIGEAKLLDGTPVRWRPHLIDALDTLLAELRKVGL